MALVVERNDFDALGWHLLAADQRVRACVCVSVCVCARARSPVQVSVACLDATTQSPRCWFWGE